MRLELWYSFGSRAKFTRDIHQNCVLLRVFVLPKSCPAGVTLTECLTSGNSDKFHGTFGKLSGKAVTCIETQKERIA